MNKGFSYYFRSGIASAKDALKGESFATRCSLILYFVMSFLGKLFFLTAPIFMIADVNLSKMICESKSFSFEKVFENTDDGKRYLRLLVFCVIKFLIILCGILLLATPVVITWIYLPYVIADTEAYIIVSSIFTAIFGILIILFVAYIELLYLPAPYIAATNNNLTVSDYLYNASKGIFGLKRTAFLLWFVYFLINIGIYGTLIGGMVCLILFAGSIGFAVAMILLVTMLFITLFFVNILFVGERNSKYLLCKFSVSEEKVLMVTESEENEDEYETVFEEEDGAEE